MPNNRFVVKKVMITENQKKRYRYAIVLKNLDTSIPIAITDYADYVTCKTRDDCWVNSTNETYIYAVCGFLNFAFFDQKKAIEFHSISQVDKKLVKTYLDRYAAGKLGRFKDTGDYPTEVIVKSKRNAISLFLESYMVHNPGVITACKPKDFMTVHRRKGLDGKYQKEYIYKIPVKLFCDRNRELKQLNRDMPISIYKRFIQLGEMYDPELVFAIVLGLFGGLREGEICNVRRVESCFGPGVIMQICKAPGEEKYECTSMQLDLRHEYRLRSDYVENGNIKRENPRSIYGPFTKTVYKYYCRHLDYIKDKPCNISKPMFLNKNPNRSTGLYEAMTVAGYRRRIQKLFYEHVLPSCQNDPDPDLAIFYQSMKDHTWGAHSFRHWFTVFLLYMGVDDIQTLMELRGDRNPDSSRVYLARKGVLMAQYRSSIDKIGSLISNLEVT